MKLKIGLYLGNNIQGLQVRLIAKYPRHTVGDNRRKTIVGYFNLEFLYKSMVDYKYCGEKFPYTHQYRFLF